MRRLGSLILRVADETRVPAGSALSLWTASSLPSASRKRSAPRHTYVSSAARSRACPKTPVAIVATGPLTSPALATRSRPFSEQKHLHFYDAISPIVEAESIDLARAFRGSRYGKGGADYLNCRADTR